MRSGIISLVTLMVVAWGSALMPAQPGGPSNEIFDPEALRNGWIFSLQEGKDKARKIPKPLMVVLRCNP
jgi:hypothetical protein